MYLDDTEEDQTNFLKKKIVKSFSVQVLGNFGVGQNVNIGPFVKLHKSPP